MGSVRRVQCGSAQYYEFFGDNYTLQDIFPEQLLINDEKNQRLENADIEIFLTKKALTEIENFRKGSIKQITTGIKTIIVVSVIEVIGTILLSILFALQEKRTRFFRGLDRFWWEIILVTAITLLGLAIALCFAIWEYTIEYTQGGITGSTMRDDHDTELYLSPIFHHGICHMHPDNGMEDPPEESSGFNILSGIFENRGR